MKYGSDLMAEYIASLKIPYIALNPGASFRGLHDSLVNHPTAEMPELIECTHEEISVSIAHGYAKATGEPMAAAIHNIVGLQHASMAIFNAWCDRTPMMLFGGTGPMKVERRRPWIDWIHTALVQGNLVRDFVKWDDQPASLHSLQDSIYRAYKLTKTEPAGPVYVCFDADLQEEPLAETEENKDLLAFTIPNASGFLQTEAPAPSNEIINIIAEAIKSAKWPVIIADLAGRSAHAFELLSELSESMAVPVIDRGSRLNLPTNHPMNLSYDTQKVLAKADVVVALDVLDLFGITSKIDRVHRTTASILPPNARIFSISLNDYLVRSWSNDFQRLFSTEANILADSAIALKMLLNRLDEIKADSQQFSNDIQLRYTEVFNWHEKLRDKWMERAKEEETLNPITTPGLASKIWGVIKNEDFVVANGHLQGWTHRIFSMDKPRQYLGRSGGGGLGYGIGATIGACLAHRHQDKLIVNIQSDGDLLFTPGGLWTLAHYKLPALIVMNNNRSYYNSEEHQASIARLRNRSVEKGVIGTRLEDPFVDFATLAKSLGVEAIGPIENSDDIDGALEKALHYIKTEKKPFLLDIVTDKMGYK